jgi:diguanylate cyclase (GGDEF)-like protein/PAS domain S-box-containing protein
MAGIILSLAGVILIYVTYRLVQFVREIEKSGFWYVLPAVPGIGVISNLVFIYQYYSGPHDAFIETTIGVVSLVVSILALSIILTVLPFLVSAIRSHDELSQERDRYRTFFDYDPHPIVLKSSDSNYLVANQAYAGFLGKSPQELVGKSDDDFFPRSQANAMRNIDVQVLGAGRPNSLTDEVIGARGKRWTRFDWIPLVDKLGNVNELLVSAYDIDDQMGQVHKLEELVSTLKRDQEKLLFRQRLEHFIAVLSTRLINMPAALIDQTIDRAIKTLGEYCGVERTYLFLFEQEGNSLTAFSGWHGDDTLVYAQKIENLHDPQVAWWIEKLNRLETINIPHVGPQFETGESLQYFEKLGVKSFIAVPLVSNRSMVGFLGLDSLHKELELPSEIVTLLKTAGEMFINALERKWTAVELDEHQHQVHQQIVSLEQKNREAGLIAEMADLLQSCRTADEAFPIIARYSQQLIPVGSGALYLIRNPRDPAERVSGWGQNPGEISELELLPNECWGLRRGRLHLVTDPDEGPVCTHVHETLQGGYICAPLIAQGESVGLLHLREDGNPGRAGRVFSDFEALALAIAEHIAPAMSNLSLRDRLRSQAIRDPLTGLFNRRYMEETLDRELRRANRHHTSVGVVMCDIDQLKPINDNLGHDAGDTMLKSVGSLMERLFRGEDVACRYGGDEFTVIMPEASLSDVWQRAEQLRESLRKLSMEHEGKRLGPVTMSIGVAAYPDHGNSAERLLQVADAAVYVSKSEGGDRVMIGHRPEDGE